MIPPEAESWIEFLTTPPWSYLAVAVLVLLVVFILLLRRQPRSVTAFTSDGGQVRVTRSAISELVHTSCAQLRDVAKPAIRIRVKGGRTHLEVRLKLMSGGRLTEVAASLKEHLKLALEENLGIEKLGSINITVTGFKSGRMASRKERKEEARPAYEDEEEEEVLPDETMEPEGEDADDRFRS